MTDSNPFSSDMGTVPNAGFAGTPILGTGQSGPREGPNELFPNANDGYTGGDAMSDAVQGIQHSGASLPGGNDPQTDGIVGTALPTGPHVVGSPSEQGKTWASTPDPNTISNGVAYSADPSDMSDPGSHDPAMPDPGSQAQLSSGVSVRSSSSS
jgi:hypothetical protein